MQFPSKVRLTQEHSRLLTAAALGLLLLLAGAAWLLGGDREAETFSDIDPVAADTRQESAPASEMPITETSDAEASAAETSEAENPAAEAAGKEAEPTDTDSAAGAVQTPTPDSTAAAAAAVDRPQVELSRLLSSSTEIQRAYGFDYNPNSEDYRFHRGCDLSAASGQPVFAPAAGTVREATEDAYWGGLIIIDFPGWTAILRCVTPRVENGQQVRAGDFIASVCAAPAEAAQEPHLHVETETDGESFDPALYL